MPLNNVMHVEYGNVYGFTPNSDNMISDAYNPENVYDAGDICIYNNALYKCNTDNTTGVWNASKWDKTTIADTIGNLGDLHDAITERISNILTLKRLFNNSSVADGDSYTLSESYNNYHFLLVMGKTNVERNTILIPTQEISASVWFSSEMSAEYVNGDYQYKGTYAIKFTDTNKFQVSLSYKNENWRPRPYRIYGFMHK